MTSQFNIVSERGNISSVTKFISGLYNKFSASPKNCPVTLQLLNLANGKIESWKDFKGIVEPEAFKGGRFFQWRLVYTAPRSSSNLVEVKVAKLDGKVLQGMISIYPDQASSLKFNENAIDFTLFQDIERFKATIDQFSDLGINCVKATLSPGSKNIQQILQNTSEQLEYAHSKKVKILIRICSDTVNPNISETFK